MTSMLPDLAPGIVFFGANHYWGLRVAVLSSFAFLALDLAWKAWRRQKPSGLYVYAAAVTGIFGALDLYLKRALFFRYEAALTNVLSAVFFASTLRGGRSLIQDVAEKTMTAEGVAMSADHVFYFRLWTLIWVAYFLAKAAVYAWLAASPLSLERLLIVRAVIGNVTLYGLIALSVASGKAGFFVLRRWRLLPSARGSAGAASGRAPNENSTAAA